MTCVKLTGHAYDFLLLFNCIGRLSKYCLAVRTDSLYNTRVMQCLYGASLSERALSSLIA